MSNIVIIAEGKTEELFIRNILTPYLALKGIYLTATQISKKGEKGGDVRFVRVKNDIERHIKQQSNTFISLFVDYYGIRSDWPGLDSVRAGASPIEIADTINHATKMKVVELFAEQRADARFIPYIAVHEFEALLFSQPEVLARHLGITERKVEKVLEECNEPEAINNSPQTAPSKRLDTWSSKGKFPKTTVGIAIAEEIGIDTMRSKCPNFDRWLTILEATAEVTHG